jgi:1-deoxy-D-xylulose 5-phosphate reductoisomerase
LDGAISFPSIAAVIAAVMDTHPVLCEPGLDNILEADKWARRRAGEEIAASAHGSVSTVR